MEVSDTESTSAEGGGEEEEERACSSGKSLVCHIPDQVVYEDHTRTLPYMVTLQGVLMFLDISGFTSLTEKYSMNSKNGTDQLTKTLNGYMRALVSEIILCDGDILKFAGDAILTLWKVNDFKAMKSTVVHVLQCAMNIQEKCGKYKTSVGVTLRVKIGISAGEVMINFLGNEEFCHHATMGRAVESVNQAETFCTSGDVVISPSAWVHCAGLPIGVEMQKDDKHRKLLDLNFPQLPQILENYKTDRITQIRKSQAKLLDIKERKVRKAVIDDLDALTIKRMRLYILAPVLKKVDASQPLEYLSEIRQVTIVFINLRIREASKYEICQTLQPAFQVTYEELKKVQGLLNKVFMFDKGCTLLAIFGLPGFKHDDDAARALKCSFEITKRLSQIGKISQASIGVTTGPTYCGVVGHPHRQEYTVIGRKVNMAARLMMAYDGKVTCDNETYHHSKINKANFVSMELRTMKGLQNIGTIREYIGNQGRKHNIDALKQQELEFPLIGRLQEVNTFLTELHKIRSHPEAGDKTKVVVVSGAPGMGSTRLFDALVVKAANEGVRVVFNNLHIDDAKTPYHAVQHLLLDLLELELDSPHQQREHILCQTFKDQYIISHLSLLNDILHVKIPHSSDISHMDAKARGAAFHKLLFKMVHEVSTRMGFVMFAVDDAHYMDQESWEFVEELGCDTHTLVLISVKKDSRFIQHKAAQRVLQHATTTTIELLGLECRHLGPLACQILGVGSIPEPLQNILKMKIQGVPSWCEQLLYSMLESELIFIVPEVSSSSSLSSFPSYSSMSSDDMTLKPPPRGRIKAEAIGSQEEVSLSVPSAEEDLTQKRKTSINQEMLAAKGMSNVETKMTCSLAPDVTLSAVRIPESVKGMIQSRIDKMNELDQIIIKSASVLGDSFQRRMLETVLPKTLTSTSLQEGLARLAGNNMFECGSRPADASQMVIYSSKQDSYQRKYICYCPKALSSKENTVNDCDILCFKSASLQETAITMYTESLRHEIHLKAAKYLESLAHKCTACGGGEFIPTARVNPERTRFLASTSAGGGGEFTDGTAKIKTSTLSKLRKTHLRKGPAAIGQESEGMENQTESTLSAQSTSTVVRFDEVIRGVIDSGEEQRDLIMDVRDCCCLEILLSIFPQLIRHWRATGNLEKTVHFLMESGAASIAVDSNIQALSYLKEVNRIFKCLDEDEDPFDEDVSHIQKFYFNNWIRARNESLMGQALYYMGQLDEAASHFSRALAILGCDQPTSNIGVRIRINREKFIQWKHTKFPNRYIGSANPLQIDQLIEQTRCLSHVYHDFMSKGRPNRALLAVLQLINKAEKVNINSSEMIIAYTCMMEYCQAKNLTSKAFEFERRAQKRCTSNPSLTVDDYNSMAHLMCTSLNIKLSSGLISDAVEMGYTTNKVVSKLHDNDTRLGTLPYLAFALMLCNRLSDAAEVLFELEYVDNEADQVIGKTWFIGCCLEMLLEMGVQLEPFEKCYSFLVSSYRDAVFQIDKLPMYFACCCMALWYQRRRMESQATLWRERAEGMDPSLPLPTVMTLNCKLKLLETTLLRLEQAHIIKHEDNINQLMKRAKAEVKECLKWCKRIPVLLPRLEHLKAYWTAIIHNGMSVSKLLKEAGSLADKHGNKMESQWLQHSLNTWATGRRAREKLKQNPFWEGKGNVENTIDWHLVRDRDTKLIKYTLLLN